MRYWWFIRLVCITILLMYMCSFCFKWISNNTPREDVGIEWLNQFKNLTLRQNLTDSMTSFPSVLILKVAPFIPDEARKWALLVKDLSEAAERPSNKSTQVIFQATTFHGSWSLRHPFSPQSGDFLFKRYQCPYSCEFTTNPKDRSTADAALFHIRDLNYIHLIEDQPAHQKRIIYSMEPPWLDIIDMDKLNINFNWTMSYRANSDIVVKYGFVGKKMTESKNDKREKDDFLKKSRLGVWVASDCRTQSRREEYFAELVRHSDTVDALGSCGESFCTPAESLKCYKKLAETYFFYFSFENAICADYVTEKFYNILEQHIIPVVFGGANYSAIAPPKSYINAMDFPSPAELVKYLKVVSGNRTLYESFFEWKQKLAAFWHSWPCELCKKLHLDNGSISIKNNLKEWWIDEANCRQWEDGHFVDAKFMTPRYHSHRFKNKH